MTDVSLPARLGRIISWLLAAFTLLVVPAMLLRAHIGLGGPTRHYLLAASTAYVLACLARGALNTRLGRFILAGLLACWLGDYLGPLGTEYFLGSVAAFLVAHLLFMGAFFSHGVIPARAAEALLLLLPSVILVGLWLLPHVEGALLGPVAAYIVVITAMVAAAWGMRPGPGRWLLVVAAVLFYISDIFVARWKFVAPGDSLNAFLCYPLYYTSCLLFAFSAPGRDRAADGQERGEAPVGSR